jgi:PAS domain S-box-containing protein
VIGIYNNLGYTDSELQKLTPVNINPNLSRQEFQALIEPLLDGSETSLVFKTVHQRKDGSKYPVEVSLQLVADETPPVFVAIVMDITGSEHREALLRRSQKMEAM